MKASSIPSLVARGLARTGPPLHLTLFVTGRCPLRCRHCFHWQGVERALAGPSLEQVERLARSLGKPLLWLSLGGGEPFLREDLAALAGSFARGGLSHLTVPTSGLAPHTGERTLELLDACPQTFVSVAVSIDGPPGVHDAIRDRVGAHAAALETARELRALSRDRTRLGFGLILTVTRANQDVLAEHMHELVRELAPDNVTLNLARGTALDPELLEVDIERYREVVAAKRALVRSGALPYFQFPLARFARARDELLYERVADVALAQGSTPVGGHLPCTAGRLSAVVYEDGRVSACELPGHELGNLDDVDWDLGRLWAGARADEQRAEIRATRCQCTWECAQADNVLFSPRRWARIAVRGLRR